MRITPRSELQSRIEKLQNLMQQQGLDAVLMLQNADLFYFTGTIQQGILYVPASGEPLYLVRKDLDRARMECGLKEILPFKSPKDLPGILSDFGYPTPKSAGMELDVLPVALFQRLQKVLDGCAISDASSLIRMVRSVKSRYEIEIMKDAALQVDRVYKRAREVIRVGMTDLELAAELEFCARKQGHQGITRMRGFNSELFYGHIFSGADSAAPAFLDAPLGGIGVNPSIGQGASYKTIKAHEPITVDFAGAFDGYLVDQTRILCIGGLSDQLTRAYEDMVKIQDRLKATARPGVAWGDLYEDCYALACELGYKEHFMGSADAQVSFIGHGIGVEIDEFPFIARGFKDQVLEENMTFAFEPKAVFPGLGAVGIENTFWVGADGLKHITFSDQDLVVL
ncbi:Xaa-Pro aminopeptidase [Desulfuromonas soudanensis]|uniref:Xaa-Pro aminopeptidase n=1 Tax=Desulfuromonas soudanensis TaxID=1603606 RepID=A0A0M4D7K0_9BACT|nr:Xaa-Pro peptidase family protein [Desulfuromonas soudanensis]ALC17135.1 Xaa-Pro aminopeptidase [Desulfuromonas soudanensis]